jgi:catechol 2,3-dioxygenase-like lactoylglutathione lyase family enzyme
MQAKGIFYVFALVSELERSKKFYRDVVGWKLGTEEGNVAGFSFGPAYLVIHQDNRPSGSRIYGGGMHVEVQVDNVDAEHARLSSKGVAVTALADWPWGERNFSFKDPDGYTWSVGQQIQVQK